MTQEILTQERLMELLSYNESSGIFTWKSVTSNKVKKGDVAGCIDKPSGYRVINIDCVQYLAHRLAWLYVHGYFPDGQIDHESHCRDENGIYNLRVVDSLGNSRNKSRSKNNTSGYTGVTWDSKNKNWRAGIKVNYKTISLGSHKTKDEAVAARKNGNLKYGFHENHGALNNG